MYVQIDASKSVGKLHNFYNHIHFHPTDAIEDDWGREILEQVSHTGGAKTVRMYAMLEDIVTMDENGNLQYDFALNDKRLDFLSEKGFDVLLSYNFIPPCISSNPNELATVCKNPTRYKGKFIVTSPPKDWDLWEEICYQYTRHIVERYGIDVLSRWYLQCFNEPDIGMFFMKDVTDMRQRINNYCKLYDGFERAIRRVDNRLRIGGPALASHAEFLDGFLRHVRKNNKKLDYICFHSYGTEPDKLNNGTKPLSVYNHVEKITRVMDVCTANGFADTPLIIDEWGGAAAGFFNVDDCPKLIFRDNHIFAVYYARLLTTVADLRLPVEKMLLCLSGQHEMKKDFTGTRSLFTASGFKKPIFNAFALAAKLGDCKLLAYKEMENTALRILPTRSNDGRLAVLLTYASTHFSLDLPKAEVELRVVNTTAKRYRVWRIDQTHANAHEKFLQMGSPQTLSETQKQTLFAAAENVCTEGVFKNTLSLTMPNNSLALVELF